MIDYGNLLSNSWLITTRNHAIINEIDYIYTLYNSTA